jgi:hypothetical protein
MNSAVVTSNVTTDDSDAHMAGLQHDLQTQTAPARPFKDGDSAAVGPD